MTKPIITPAADYSLVVFYTVTTISAPWPTTVVLEEPIVIDGVASSTN
jgi:hypothetical protein